MRTEYSTEVTAEERLDPLATALIQDESGPANNSQNLEREVIRQPITRPRNDWEKAESEANWWDYSVPSLSHADGSGKAVEGTQLCLARRNVIAVKKTVASAVACFGVPTSLPRRQQEPGTSGGA